jgi:glucose uptake protein
MLLPTTATAVLVALLIGLVGWGAWASFFKAGKKIRFEFFAYDFAWGVVLTGVLAAFTLGSWDSKELTFQDNFLLAGVRKMAWAFGAGVVFNLANLLLLGATSVSGMAVAFPIAFGLAWAAGSVWTFFIQPDVNPMLAFGGAVVTVVAAILAMVGYRWLLAERIRENEAALRADPRAKTAPAPPDMGLKAFALALIAGLLFAVFFPMLGEATSGDNGVSGYGATLILSGAVWASSIVFVPFFLNFPVKGKALTVRQYVKVSLSHHLLGILGGMLWAAGLLGSVVVAGAPATALPATEVVYALNHGAPLLAGLLGLFVWGEFRGAPTRANAMMLAVLVLLAAGMGMIAVAPVYGR